MGRLMLICSTILLLECVRSRSLSFSEQWNKIHARPVSEDGIVKIPFLSYYDATFHTEIKIGGGDNQVNLRVMLSTGSNELWVPAKDCDTAMLWCRGHRTFDNSKSESYRATDRKFHASIGDSVLSGRVGRDTVGLGEIQINLMEMGEATTSSADFNYVNYDGVLGLGPRMQSEVGTGLLQRLLQEAYLRDTVFSFVLSDEKSGHLVLGGVDEQHFEGDLVWSNINSQDEWQIPLETFTLGGTSLCPSKCSVDFNTEMELITGPKEQVDKIYRALNAREIPGVIIWSVDCDQVKNFPDLVLKVKGQNLAITPAEYVEVLKFASIEMCYLKLGVLEEDTLTKGIRERWVIGALGHRPLHVVYDFGRKRIGLAKAKY